MMKRAKFVFCVVERKIVHSIFRSARFINYGKLQLLTVNHLDFFFELQCPTSVIDEQPSSTGVM